MILMKLTERDRRLASTARCDADDVTIRDHTADEMATASLSAIQTMSFAIQHQKWLSRRRLADAIDRYRHGQYGKCLDCGIGIDVKRLEILPEAEFCLKCQKASEPFGGRSPSIHDDPNV